MTSSDQSTLLKLSRMAAAGNAVVWTSTKKSVGLARMSDIIVGKTPLMQAEEAPGFPVAGGVRTTTTGPLIPDVPL